MPVNLRRKGSRGMQLSQIHRDSNVPVQKNGTSTSRGGKRRSSGSPQQQAPSSKRAAFGDITNAYRNVTNFAKGKGKSSSTILKPLKKSTSTVAKKEKAKENRTQIERPSEADSSEVASSKVETSRVSSAETSSAEVSIVVPSSGETTSNRVDDIFMLSPADVPLPDSSLEDEPIPEDVPKDHVQLMNLKNLENAGKVTPTVEKIATIELDSAKTRTVAAEPAKPDIVDIDQENKDDPNQSPQYAFEIFKYLRYREGMFRVTPYFEKQTELTTHMRAILMDWLVEVQENFELNHETLYLAVKLVDLYLTKIMITKDTLQLLGAAAMFISCKFDERCPPALEDFIFICDDAYDRRQFLKMEKDLLKCIDYDLGMPLSYRFLRRYAKCVHASMETLTLGRFILELSLMETEFIYTSESKIAAAALLLSFKMKGSGEWNATLVHFSGYKLSDLTHLVQRLNVMLAKPAQKQINTVRTKYSHPVFYEVAKIPALKNLGE